MLNLTVVLLSVAPLLTVLKSSYVSSASHLHFQMPDLPFDMMSCLELLVTVSL